MLFEETEKIFKKNQNQILAIFKKIQFLEFWLFMKIAGKQNIASIQFKEKEKILNALLKKTMGVLVKEHNELFSDKRELCKLLDSIVRQRNKFMHIFYIWCLLHRDKKKMKNRAGLVLKSLEKNIDKAINFMSDKAK